MACQTQFEGVHNMCYLIIGTFVDRGALFMEHADILALDIAASHKEVRV